MGSISEGLRVSLPVALAISASPAAIIGMILTLMTRQARRNSLLFLAGWYSGLFLVGIIFLNSPGFYTLSGEPSILQGWVRIGLGSITMIAGLFLLRKVLKREDGDAHPKWSDKVDSFGVWQALFFGFFFAAPNVKNASMVTSGAASIGNVGLSGIQELNVLIVFCLVASIGVLIPPLIFLLFRKKAELFFGKMKVWLIRYQFHILTIICIVFGGLFLYQGLAIVYAF